MGEGPCTLPQILGVSVRSRSLTAPLLQFSTKVLLTQRLGNWCDLNLAFMYVSYCTSDVSSWFYRQGILKILEIHRYCILLGRDSGVFLSRCKIDFKTSPRIQTRRCRWSGLPSSAEIFMVMMGSWNAIASLEIHCFPSRIVKVCIFEEYKLKRYPTFLLRVSSG